MYVMYLCVQYIILSSYPRGEHVFKYRRRRQHKRWWRTSTWKWVVTATKSGNDRDEVYDVSTWKKRSNEVASSTNSTTSDRHWHGIIRRMQESPVYFHWSSTTIRIVGFNVHATPNNNRVSRHASWWRKERCHFPRLQVSWKATSSYVWRLRLWNWGNMFELSTEILQMCWVLSRCVSRLHARLFWEIL